MMVSEFRVAEDMNLARAQVIVGGYVFFVFATHLLLAGAGAIAGAVGLVLPFTWTMVIIFYGGTNRGMRSMHRLKSALFWCSKADSRIRDWSQLRLMTFMHCVPAVLGSVLGILITVGFYLFILVNR